MANKKARKSIHFVSLGCPKNRVDSEVMLGVAENAGYQHVDDPKAAEVIVINTCGFIDAAKQESIETIVELSALKEQGACKKLVVTGCLSQRHPQELAEGLPEVDHFLGSSDMLRLGAVLEGKAPRVFVGQPADWVVQATDPRRLSTRGRSAYLKLAEGCNRTCAFCVIPELRGKQRSRTEDDILLEAQGLLERGVLELNLISQDTVAYGRDLKDGSSLSGVVERLAELPSLYWLRLFYLYPDKLDPRLLELMAQHEKVLPYLDMPLQHAADAMLRRMRRGHGGKRLYEVVEQLRAQIPSLTFRTAFIVGHPGETDAEFKELLDFVRWAEFDRLGVFEYSDESSARAYNLPDKVPPEVAHERALQLMELQRGISRKKQQALVGRTLEVLLEGPSEESELVVVGRHGGQAPEIDGLIYLSGDGLPGEVRRAEVIEALDYDLHAELLEEPPVIGAPAARPRARTRAGRTQLRTWQ